MVLGLLLVYNYVLIPVFRCATYGLPNIKLIGVNGMVLYRRNRVAGGTYFFTVTLRDRSSDLLVRHVGLLRSAFRAVRTQRTLYV